jgi:hypothetical protein
MKKALMKLAKHAGIAAGIVAAVTIIACLGVSWIATCGIIKLITLCFGWTFSWGIATGIWLIMCLLSSVFKSNVSVKK